MKRYIILLVAALLFGACSDDESAELIIKEKAERTVFVYMAADNNLSQVISGDIQEMKEGSKKLNDRQNLIIYVDQETKPSFIARIKDGELVDVSSKPEQCSADPAVLEKTLQYMRNNYPAESYGLVLWGHSDGWHIINDSVVYPKNRAYGGDEGGHPTYWMNIPSMARAIANGMGCDYLHFIFADCCNFANVESAYELRDLTDYLIGSPAEIPARGAPYDLIIPQLFDTSDTFCESVINTYHDYYKEEYNMRPFLYYNLKYGDLDGYSVPLSVIKTDELDNLAQATARLLSTIPDKLTPEGTFRFDGAIYYRFLGARSAYDICHTLKMNTAESDFNEWKLAFLKAVPYRRFSRNWETVDGGLRQEMLTFDATADECGVVSMFFPSTTYQSLTPNWNTAIQSYQWNNVIRWQQYGW